MLSAKQDGIKYHFLSLRYNLIQPKTCEIILIKYLCFFSKKVLVYKWFVSAFGGAVVQIWSNNLWQLIIQLNLVFV